MREQTELEKIEEKIDENDRAMINCKIYHNNHQELLEEHKKLRNLRIEYLKKQREKNKMNKNKDIFEKIYEKPGAIWTDKHPPEGLLKLIESGKIKPCKVLDIGCGEGFYSIYLASKGFDVLGIDISENAIKYAKENAEKAGVKVRFKAMDLRDLPGLKDKFNFILEWTILHEIAFDERQKHVENVNNLLNIGGKYLSVCFNEQDVKFIGPDKKVRIVPEGYKNYSGMKMYFSSLNELKELFEIYFKIIEGKIIEFPGVDGTLNVWNYFFMEKEKTK